jgi:hypothetical protein
MVIYSNIPRLSAKIQLLFLYPKKRLCRSPLNSPEFVRSEGQDQTKEKLIQHFGKNDIGTTHCGLVIGQRININ